MLNDIGMLDSSKVHQIAGSDKLKMDPGAMKGWQLAMRDPYEWVQKVLMPHMTAAYGDDKEKVAAAMAKFGRNRNVIRMLTMMSDPGFIEQIEKDVGQWSQASGIDKAYGDAMSRNPAMIKKAFGDQYESMMQSIGAPMMQAAISVTKAVTDLFTTIGKWANTKSRNDQVACDRPWRAIGRHGRRRRGCAARGNGASRLANCWPRRAWSGRRNDPERASGTIWPTV